MITITELESHVVHNCGNKQLTEKISQIAKPHGPIYRGIYYHIDDLKIGGIYKHWYEITSWSKSLEVAKCFALNYSNVSEGIIEAAHNKKYGKIVSWDKIPDEEWETVSKEFVKIVLIDHNGQGVFVNEYVQSPHTFTDEQEVVVAKEKWRITAIQYEPKNQLYFVTVVAIDIERNV